MAMGMFMSSPDFLHMGLNQNSIGSLGTEGSTCFADPNGQIGCGYAMNRMCEEMNNGPRAANLINAAYQCL